MKSGDVPAAITWRSSESIRISENVIDDCRIRLTPTREMIIRDNVIQAWKKIRIGFFLMLAAVSLVALPPGVSWAEVTESSSGIPRQVLAPATDASGAVAPSVSPALEASHVVKASAGNLFSIYASALTGGSSGYLLVFDLATVPGDGPVTPVIVVPFSGGVASASYLGGPPARFANGIVAVVSSASTPFTKTTGTLTAYFSGLAK
jgi:hypothetical protein